MHVIVDLFELHDTTCFPMVGRLKAYDSNQIHNMFSMMLDP
jgi:hypothetical protein